MQMPPINPHGSPVPAVRTKLPDISGHRHHSAPPDIIDEADPFMQGHSKLYVRRREIEAELRREFNLPEEEVLREVMYGRGTGPLMFGRPPPVPKPRRNQTQLPQIPRLHSEPPRARWGRIDDPDPLREKPQSPKEKEEKWWRQEQQELRRQASRQSPEPGAPVQEQPSPSHASQARQEISATTVRMGRDRPSSWRNARSERQFAAEGPPVQPMGSPTPSFPSAPHIGSYPAPSPPPPHAHVDKARELEEIAREFRQRHAARHEDERRRVKEAAEREAKEGFERRAEEEEKERRRRMAEEKIEEAKRQEERRFEELKEKELRQRRREAEDADRRRSEQEDWEREIRKRFKDEERLRRQQQQKELAEEAERQSKIRANWDQERAERAQEAAQREREREKEREEARKVEAEQWRRRQEEEHRRQEEESEMQRRAAAAEAERLKRNWDQAGFSQPPPPPPPPHGRGRARAEVPPPKRWQPPETQARASSSSPSPPRERSRRAASVPAPAATVHLPPDEVIRQAEIAAMQQLKALQQLPSKEERQRGFKDLLRAWHPDKNPQNVEVATAVFQRLQAERKKALS